MRYYQKSASLVVFILICVTNTLSMDLYKEYKKSEESFLKKEYKKSYFILENVLENHPKYSEAKLLKYKINYELNRNNELDFNDLLEDTEEIKENLMEFLLEKKNEKLVEIVYKRLENKKKYKESFMKLLFDKKKYKSILEEYNDINYLEVIEDKKNKADILYFEAIDLIKKNEVNKAKSLLMKAIELFPENTVYYSRLGKVHADRKNYYFAEYYLKKAFEIDNSKENNLNLFNLYMTMKSYDKLYSIADNLIDLPKVRNVLRELYLEDINSNRGVKFIKRENDKIYLEKKSTRDLSIGDTILVRAETERIRNNTTGEVLGIIKKSVAKIRVYNIIDNIIVFHILEENEKINIENDYYIK